MQQAPDLRKVIEDWFEAVSRGDTSWVDRHVSRSPGVRLVGTDPDEWLQGEQVAEFLKGEAEAIGGSVTVSFGDTEAYCEGTVGWGIARPILTFPDGQAFSPRWAGVFHREDGEWKLVQVHASVGIPNEQLLGAETPA